MSQSPQIGKTLRNRYKIIKLLGSGGFGDTYLAVDGDLPGLPQCVVKHLKPKDPNPAVLPIAKSLFEREAQVLYRLGTESNQIPKLFAHFEENGEFYLVEEFVDGHDLSAEITQGLPLDENVVFKLLKDILEVLAVVHQHNVIHRDIKPQNIMRRRKDGKIVLIDFGAVKEIGAMVVNSQGETSVTVVVGSRGYMPPEQALGRPKLSSDVYAVGMLGIQTLTGLMPYELKEDPSTGELVWRNLGRVSEAVANVLDTMIRDRFTQRYQSAAEALQALISTASASTVALPPPPPSPSQTPFTVALPPPPPSPSQTPFTERSPVRPKSLLGRAFIGLGITAAFATVAVLIRHMPGPSRSPISTSPGSPFAPTLDRPDYTRLQQLLAAENWKEADRETKEIMLELAGRNNEGWLRNEDIDKLSCKDLKTIDQLWIKSSNGRFGFNVQKRLWENLGGKPGIRKDSEVYSLFDKRVGWRDKNHLFTPNSPLGHFPMLWTADSWEEPGWGVLLLAQKLANCNR